MTRLDGAVILVTGATGGLGSRVSTRLTDAGATVVRAARRPASLTGDDAMTADLRAPGAPAALVAATLERHGRLDGLVVAAGVVAFGPAADLEDATIDELFETNALGPMRLIRDAMPALAASAAEGREPFVLTLSGIVADTPTAGLAAYSASKAALAAFTTAASREFRRQGVRLVDARPGHTETGLATRPIEGTAPAFPTGYDPDAVAERVVRAIADGEKDLPDSAFAPAG
ncbi:SDR family NAD(P)-dependent oxidoreductase [Marisediminicola sp. LYQ134]|uniref:SDR family NAD(P)-dependent oxidoreductase n=1 Tax=unclassified Marisediminicola TaxID=2618316 RepID=UPI00398380DB